MYAGFDEHKDTTFIKEFTNVVIKPLLRPLVLRHIIQREVLFHQHFVAKNSLNTSALDIKSLTPRFQRSCQ